MSYSADFAENQCKRPVNGLCRKSFDGMLRHTTTPAESTLLESEGWMRRGALQGPLEAALSERRIPIQLWRLLVLEHWLERRLAERG